MPKNMMKFENHGFWKFSVWPYLPMDGVWYLGR